MATSCSRALRQTVLPAHLPSNRRVENPPAAPTLGGHRKHEEIPMLTLYEHPFALYCQKVLIALKEEGVAYDVLEEQRDFDRAGLAELWPPASIPVLRDGDQVIGET